MKIDEEPVDEIKAALIAFFEREGGYGQVAKVIGGNPQQLYYIVSGRNDPSLKTVMRILRHYPDEVELRRVLSLPVLKQVSTTGLSPIPPTAPQGSVLAINGEPDWKALYYEMASELKSLREKYENLVEIVMKKMSFPETSSYSPVPPQPRQWITGLRSSLVPDFNADEPVCIVRPLWPVSHTEREEVA